MSRAEKHSHPLRTYTQKHNFVKITIFRQFLFGYSYLKNCNGDKKIVKATKMIVISTDQVVVYGNKARLSASQIYLLLWQCNFFACWLEDDIFQSRCTRFEPRSRAPHFISLTRTPQSLLHGLLRSALRPAPCNARPCDARYALRGPQTNRAYFNISQAVSLHARFWHRAAPSGGRAGLLRYATFTSVPHNNTLQISNVVFSMWIPPFATVSNTVGQQRDEQGI